MLELYPRWKEDWKAYAIKRLTLLINPFSMKRGLKDAKTQHWFCHKIKNNSMKRGLKVLVHGVSIIQFLHAFSSMKRGLKDY